MLPHEIAGAGAGVVWTRARYLAKLSFSVSRFDAWSQPVLSSNRQQSMAFIGILPSSAAYRLTDNSLGENHFHFHCGKASSRAGPDTRARKISPSWLRTRMISPSRPRSRQVTLAVIRKRSDRNAAIAWSPGRTVGFGSGSGGTSRAGCDTDASRHNPPRVLASAALAALRCA